jgi:hypothetical protein
MEIVKSLNTDTLNTESFQCSDIHNSCMFSFEINHCKQTPVETLSCVPAASVCIGVVRMYLSRTHDLAGLLLHRQAIHLLETRPKAIIQGLRKQWALGLVPPPPQHTFLKVHSFLDYKMCSILDVR